MYAPPNYGGGFGQGQPGYNPTGSAPQTPQHLQQPPQQPMMYNPQQFAAGQSPYGAAAAPANMAMGTNTGMMPNGMPHMGGNNGIVSQHYQTPYSGSPYGAGIPTSMGGPQQQFMTPISNTPNFGMNPQNMTPQGQHIQRMQPHPTSTPIPPSQRVSPYGGMPHNTPPHNQPQSQFMTPQTPVPNQHQNQSHQPTQNHIQTQVQPQQAAGQQTPQTPNFPPNSAGATGNNMPVSTPLSPGSETREKERVTLLLEINRELLLEVMRLQAQQGAKKENATPAGTNGTTDGENKPAAETKPDGPKPAITGAAGKEFVECMRRLQSNLAYLAAIADRSHKPSSQIPPHPAIISAPPLSPLPKGTPRFNPDSSTTTTTTDGASTNTTNGNASTSSPADGTTTGSTDQDTEDRLDILKSQYARLQSLFPGVDPKKEPPLQSAAQAAAAKQQQAKAAAFAAQQQPGGSGGQKAPAVAVAAAAAAASGGNMAAAPTAAAAAGIPVSSGAPAASS